jgi:hypothetical protein
LISRMKYILVVGHQDALTITIKVYNSTGIS